VKDKDPLYQKVTALNRSIKRALEDSNYLEAKNLVSELFTIADQFQGNWHYDNLIHLGYSYAGLIALEEGNIEIARESLLLAINIKASPQIKSFGPNMALAEKLLELGEKQVVLKYLKLCKKLWFFPFGFFNLRRWKKMVKADQMPNFGFNKIAHMH